MRNPNQHHAEERRAVEVFVRLANAAGMGPFEVVDPERVRSNDEPDAEIRSRDTNVGMEVTKVWDGLSQDEQDRSGRNVSLLGRLREEIEGRLAGLCAGAVSIRVDRAPRSKHELKDLADSAIRRVRQLAGRRQPHPSGTESFAGDVQLLGGSERPLVLLSEAICVPEQAGLEQAVRDAIARKNSIRHAGPQNWLLLTDYSLTGIATVDLQVDALKLALASTCSSTPWNKVFLLLGYATKNPLLIELR